jgi:hypothetical protein
MRERAADLPSPDQRNTTARHDAAPSPSLMERPAPAAGRAFRAFR